MNRIYTIPRNIRRAVYKIHMAWVMSDKRLLAEILYYIALATISAIAGYLLFIKLFN